jgi:hypothetical protein
VRQWWSKATRALGRRPNLANELQQEMDAQVQFLIDENLERGMARDHLPTKHLSS